MAGPILETSKYVLAQSYVQKSVSPSVGVPCNPDTNPTCLEGGGGGGLPPLRASISGATNACAGDPVAFSAGASGPYGPGSYSYKWYEGYNGVSYSSVGSGSSYSTTMPPGLDLYMKLKVTSVKNTDDGRRLERTALAFHRVTNLDGSLYCMSYKVEAGEITLAEQGQLSEAFVLNEAYPNPFNPSTVIAYDLPESADVELAVYDVMGREVARLVDSYREAGYHRVVFDASHLPSGVYLYRLQTGSFVVSKQITFLK